MKEKRSKAKRCKRIRIIRFAKANKIGIDELVSEALIAGMRYDEIYQATWGEVVAFVDAYNERKRREYQNLSVIAYKQAYMTAAYLSGSGKDIEAYDVFPYWTDEEVEKLTLQRYKNMLLKNSE